MKNNAPKLFFLLCLLLCLMIPSTCKKLEKELLVSTGDVTNILTNSADASGQVIDLGDGATDYGHCYATTANPTIASSKTQLGVPAVGGFTSQLTNLTAGTKYYIKAYITDGTETRYGKEITFTTAAASLPVLTTSAISSITSTMASSGGNITSDGGTNITVSGICWGTSSGPTTSGSKTVDGTASGSFISNLTGLTANTTYYVRSYATNSAGTSYGNELSFITSAAEISVLTTTTITSITQATASSGGNISSDGGAQVTAYGVCWNSASGPTIANNKTIDGTGTGSFSSSLTGLTANTTYYVRAYATNNAGTAYGNELSFTTIAVAAVIPTLTTTSVTSVTQITAVSGGTITSDGGATITISGICWSTTSGPTINSSKTTDGTSSGSFTSNLTGLTSNTTYYVRAYAINSIGTAYGNEVSFTTNSTTSTPPTAAAAAATSITNTTTTLNGAVNANGSSTTVTFEYGVTILYGSTSNATPGTATGSSTTTVSAALIGLTPGTNYHYRVKAVNAGGTTYSNDLSFTTLQIPTATTDAATSITNVAAKLNGSANANNVSATVTFEYGTSIAYGSTITGAPNPVTGGSLTSVSADITGLIPNTGYHFRVKAVSSGGTTYGGDQTFTTLCTEPTVTTDAATNVADVSGTINGTINANGFSTTVTYEYGTTTSYGSTITATPGTVPGSTNTPVSADITGLIPNTLYHYRVKSVNCGGTIYGSDQSLTTLCTAPSATSEVATNLNPLSATLNGTVNANYSSTTATFEYGTTTSYGSTIAATPGTITGNTNTAVSAGITGLIPSTVYHFRLNTINCGGATNGSDQTFTTVCTAPAATTNAATSLTNITATLNGTVNANYSSTIVTFDYGTSVSYGSSAVALQSPLTGNTSTDVSIVISGLVPNTLYHFRVNTVSCGGTIYGDDQTFTTLCTAPSATSNAATGIGTTTATLYGTANANNFSTTVTFDYGTTISYGSSVTASQSPLSGSGNTPVSAGLASLIPNTQYHYRVNTVNCGGTIYGNDQTFTTLCAAPSATTNTATSVSNLSATLNGTMNANYSSTTVTFDYGLTNGYGSSVAAIPGTVTGSSNTSVSAGLVSLNPNTQYHFRVNTVNCGGTIYGDDQTFTTLCTAPSATSASATSVSDKTATLNGTVNANNFSTTVTFDYGSTVSYGSTVTASQSPLTGSSNSSVSAGLTNLNPNTQYHFRVNSVNCGGTIYGSDQTFTTLCTVPTATTNAAGSITNLTAILNGTVNANNFSTTVTFDYGTTVSYGSTVTASQSPLAGSSNTSVSASVSNLSPNTLYHFRVTTVNCGGIIYGSDHTFTTLCTAPSATTNAASNILLIKATFNGTVNANNFSTTVTFDFGTTTSYGYSIPASPGTVTGTGNTTVFMTVSSLSGNTTYHYRVKAVNCGGTTYGDDVTFTTANWTVADIDGNSYDCIFLGNQVWMKENLKTTRSNDGVSLNLVTDNTSWSIAFSPSYCWYNNNIANKAIYGALYNWFALTTGKLCPTGWHVPTDGEWTTLTDYLTNNGYGYQGSGDDIAKSMASTSGWATYTTAGTIGNNQTSNNASGFTALPGDGRAPTGAWDNSLTYLGFFWSTTQYDGFNAYIRFLSYNLDHIYRDYIEMQSGFSVRCVRN